MYFIQNDVNTDTGIMTYVNFRSEKFSLLKTIAKMQSRIFPIRWLPLSSSIKELNSKVPNWIHRLGGRNTLNRKIMTTDVLDFVNNSGVEQVKIHLG